jgi:methyl-accepting chemotaxis protein
MNEPKLVAASDSNNGRNNEQDVLINHAAIDVCYEMLCDMLTSSASEVESSANTLSGSFRGISDLSNQQGAVLDRLVQTLSQLEHKGHYITLKDFINMMDENISDTIGKIVEISGNAMSLAFTMEGVVEQLDSIQKFIVQVNKINQKTRMLALNATIEAARAGEAGKGFSVVADEVKQVAKQINNMASEMQAQITNIANTIRNGQDTLGVVAGIDMSANIAARSDLDELMQSLLKQNASVSEIMQQSSLSVKDVSSQISRITVSVQFQDRNSQIIANIVALIKAMRDHEKDPVNNPLPVDPAEALEKISSVITLSAIKQKLFETATSRGLQVHHTGNNQNIFIHEEKSASVNSDDDDIELF